MCRTPALLSCYTLQLTTDESAIRSMPDSDDISQLITDRLEEVLKEVDLDITTQKQIVNKLAEELGEDVREHKALIKVEVAGWSLLLPLCVIWFSGAEQN